MIPRSVVSVARQGNRLGQLFPDSAVEIRRGTLTWIGDLQPSDFSAVYTAGLEYKLGRKPKVFVIAPALQERDGERPPHLYADDCLCLYFPTANEWNARMMLADTIVPWASEWLLHYEIWLATGKWQGGGIHPRGDLKSRRD